MVMQPFNNGLMLSIGESSFTNVTFHFHNYSIVQSSDNQSVYVYSVANTLPNGNEKESKTTLQTNIKMAYSGMDAWIAAISWLTDPSRMISMSKVQPISGFG